MRILGIESSADETSAAVVEDGNKLLSNVIASSLDLHVAFGGIVPEIAARSHIEVIIPTIEQALGDAKTDWDNIDAIGVTYGPGLSGSLLIGVMTARTLAIAKNKPLYAVNHVEAHVYAAFLGNMPEFPILALIVSGGHTQLVLFTDHFKYKILGQTADDAIGEAFDKVAKMLGLPYPGGPSVSECAKNGNPNAIKLPKAKMTNRLDFSFSGLKTAVLRAAQELAGKDYTLPSSHLPELLNESLKADLAASFQRVALETVVEALQDAVKHYSPVSVVVAGGVAASSELRKMLTEVITLPLLIPEFKLCTDNGAMIAANAYFQASLQKPLANPYKLGIEPGLSM